MASYVHTQLHLADKPEYNGQLHVMERICLDPSPGAPAYYWQIRNVETGEILSRDELISDVLIDASVKHDKQIPFEVSNQPFEKIEVKQC